MESEALLLSRLQFAWVVAWHILLPAFTVGLASYIAVLEGLHLFTGRNVYVRISQFWIRIFAVSFGLGVVTGIVMPFQFGTNWSRFSDVAGDVISPLLAYEAVLERAGATRPARDDVDLRMVEAVRTRSGQLLKNDPAKVGGWPELAATAPPPDRDADGMADAWEVEMGLNPDDPADGVADADGDGWTNFEEYLHQLAGDGVGMRAVRADHDPTH